MEHESDASLHIERTGTSKAVIGDGAGHGFESAHGIDGVVMAEEENGFAAGLAFEVDLEVIAEVGDAVEFGMSGECFEASGKHGGDLVARRLVVAGRFQFDQLANGIDDGIAAGLEILETALGIELRH